MKKEFLVNKIGGIMDKKIKDLKEDLESKEKYLRENLDISFEDYITRVRKSTYVEDKDLQEWKDRQIEHTKTQQLEITEIKKVIKYFEDNTTKIKASKKEYVYNGGGIVLKIEKDDNRIDVICFKSNELKSYTFAELEKLRKQYMGNNVIHKPFLILLYQQEIKNSTYGLKPSYITQEGESLEEFYNRVK